MGLFEKYLETQQSVEVTKVAEAEDAARIEVIAEFAKQAELAIQAEGVTNYTEEDVMKVASAMIDAAVEEEQEAEKIAELVDMGRIIGDSMADAYIAKVAAYNAANK